MMIKGLIRYTVGVLVALSVSLPLNAAEKLILDGEHSYVLWRIQHLGFSTQAGKWYVKDGFVILDKDQPQNSKVEATIDVANFITGIPELDKHLKGKLFFDTDRYPTATFVSDKVEVTGQNTAKVHGLLTLRGVSKPVTLQVTFNKAGKNPINERMTVGFSATTELKRSDFGMKTLIPNLGDEVSIEIGAEAYLPNANGNDNATTKQ